MIAAQLVTFLVMTLSRLPWMVRLVSRMVVDQVAQALGPLGGAQHVVVDVLVVRASARRRRRAEVAAHQGVDDLAHRQHDPAQLRPGSCAARSCAAGRRVSCGRSSNSRSSSCSICVVEGLHGVEVAVDDEVEQAVQQGADAVPGQVGVVVPAARPARRWGTSSSLRTVTSARRGDERGDLAGDQLAGVRRRAAPRRRVRKSVAVRSGRTWAAGGRCAASSTASAVQPELVGHQLQVVAGPARTGPPTRRPTRPPGARRRRSSGKSSSVRTPRGSSECVPSPQYPARGGDEADPAAYGAARVGPGSRGPAGHPGSDPDRVPDGLGLQERASSGRGPGSAVQSGSAAGARRTRLRFSAAATSSVASPASASPATPVRSMRVDVHVRGQPRARSRRPRR